MSIAEPDQVALRLGRELSASEEAQVQALLDDVETEMRTRIPGFDARLISESGFSEVVELLEIRSVRRVMLNPDGVRQRSDSVDDHTESATVDDSLSTGDLYLSDAEWAMLIPAQSAGTVHGWGGYA